MAPGTATRSARGPGRPAGGPSGAGRRSLLDAARGLLAECGLAALTSKAVAERANLRPTLVNYYFNDRNGLLQALVEEISGDINHSVVAAAAEPGPVDRRLVRVIEGILRRFAKEPCAARLFFEQVLFADEQSLDQLANHYGRATNEALRSVLADGVRDGSLEDADLEMAVATIGGLCIFFGAATPLIQRTLNIEPLTSDNATLLAERASALVLNGLMKPAAAS